MKALLLLAISIFLCQCTTTSVDTVAVVRTGTTYYASKELSKAKTPQAWEARYARLVAVQAAFTVVNSGLTPAVARALIAKELSNDPDKMLIVDLLLTLAPADASTVGLHNDWLQAVITGLDLALKATMPQFQP